MPITKFPSLEHATPEGIVAMGGDLHPESLLLAYRQGIFPWPIEGLPLTWFSPPSRAILEFDRLHIPRSLERERRRTKLRFTIDQDFESVIRHCAEVERTPIDGAPSGSWITPWMREAYIEFHSLGHAHSVEAWNGERLVGGLYGVDVDGAFAGESMFMLEPHASKLALLHLIDHLRSRGVDWIDIQQLTPHMERLGAREIPRAEFLEKLKATRARGLELF